MSKKFQEEPEAPENHERWLLTYADLITLLLIFFIIMYTMAKLDASKYQIMKEALAGALKTGTVNIKQGTDGILDKAPPKKQDQQNPGKEKVKMDNLELKLVDLVRKYNLQDYIKITQEERGLDIEIRNELMNVALFESGSAQLNPAATDIISKIGTLLTELPDNYIRIEGHTDNQPISKPFASNWELSTARATNVLRFMAEKCGLDQTHLSAVGYGQYKPVGDNSTLDGRAKNRRVNIVIIKSKYNAVESN